MFTNHLRLNVIFFLMFYLVHSPVHPSIDATNKMKSTAKYLLSTVTVKILDSISGLNVQLGVCGTLLYMRLPAKREHLSAHSQREDHAC